MRSSWIWAALAVVPAASVGSVYVGGVLPRAVKIAFKVTRSSRM